MANLLLAWELGGGLGHLSVLEPLAAELSRRGHSVYLAAREPHRAGHFAAGCPLTVVAAPHQQAQLPHKFEPAHTLAHVLYNAAWGDPVGLGERLAQWRAIYREIRPQVIVCDHAPTALLAARGENIPTVVAGAGFFCPDTSRPLPDWRPHLGVAPEVFAEDERRILAHTNGVLRQSGIRELAGLLEPYSDAAETLLCTLPSLDPFGPREGSTYRGHWLPRLGKNPAWPPGSGKRVFVYVKQSPVVPQLLSTLARWRIPTLVAAGSLDRSLTTAFAAAPTLRFETEMLDMAAIAQECDLAITNGTHFTALQMLLAGKPVVSLPIFLDQQLAAQAIARLAAGLTLSAIDPSGLEEDLAVALQLDSFRHAAQSFATAHAQHDPSRELQTAVAAIGAFVGK